MCASSDMNQHRRCGSDMDEAGNESRCRGPSRGEREPPSQRTRTTSSFPLVQERTERRQRWRYRVAVFMMEEVCVLTCLIVVNVAKTIETPTANVSAANTNRGPIIGLPYYSLSTMLGMLANWRSAATTKLTGAFVRRMYLRSRSAISGALLYWGTNFVWRA
jgi:hypothetical protein